MLPVAETWAKDEAKPQVEIQDMKCVRSLGRDGFYKRAVWVVISEEIGMEMFWLVIHNLEARVGEDVAAAKGQKIPRVMSV